MSDDLNVGNCLLEVHSFVFGDFHTTICICHKLSTDFIVYNCCWCWLTF